jgi:hypothetical protein
MSIGGILAICQNPSQNIPHSANLTDSSGSFYSLVQFWDEAGKEKKKKLIFSLDELRYI